MFDDVAPRYDRTNDVLSLGQARLWRRAVLAAVDPRQGERILDLAGGTGTSAEPFHRAGADVIPCDFSFGMLKVGKERLPHLGFTAGDALKLPFAAGAFDAVTISFGLRNVHDTDAALVEMRRVTRPGGRLAVCEFSHPTWPLFRTIYVEYLMRALPPVAVRVSSNPEAYVYLAESIRAWPDQPALAARISATGWQEVAWRNLTGGIVALHRAIAPGECCPSSTRPPGRRPAAAAPPIRAGLGNQPAGWDRLSVRSAHADRRDDVVRATASVRSGRGLSADAGRRSHGR